MKRWREKLAAALLSVSFLALTPIAANAQSCDPCCDPCDWDFCDQCFEVGVDFLYWKPCIDDLDFAFSFKTRNSNTETEVVYKDICPEWEPGVRVFVNLPGFLCKWDLGISWTYMKSDESEHLEAPSSGDVSSPLLHPGLIEALSGSSGGRFKDANGDWELCYHDWDILLSYNVSCNRCHEFSPFFGVAGICVDQKLKVELTNPTGVNNDDTGEIKWNSEYWGVGLRAGSHYHYRFNDCVSFFARADGTLLAGEVSSKNKQEVTDGSESMIITTDLELKDDDCCHCVPGYHLSAGIIYDATICCCEFTFRLGYEFVEWHNMPNHRVFSGNNLIAEVPHSSSASTRTLGFHGLLAGLLFSF